MLEIRQEDKNDYDEVYKLIRTAFETAEQKGVVQYAKEFGI